MKGKQLFVGGEAGLEHERALLETAMLELAQEGTVTVRTEGVTLAEAIAREAFACDDCQPGSHFARALPHLEGLVQGAGAPAQARQEALNRRAARRALSRRAAEERLAGEGRQALAEPRGAWTLLICLSAARRLRASSIFILHR